MPPSLWVFGSSTVESYRSYRHGQTSPPISSRLAGTEPEPLTCTRQSGFRHLCNHTAALGVQRHGIEPCVSSDQTEPITGPLPCWWTHLSARGSRDLTPQVCHASTATLRGATTTQAVLQETCARSLRGLRNTGPIRDQPRELTPTLETSPSSLGTGYLPSAANLGQKAYRLIKGVGRFR